MLQRGSTGYDVAAWQQTLVDQGYSVAVDGVFGAETETATKAFQRSRSLTADGIVGPATRAASSAPAPAKTPASSAPAAGRLSAAGRALIKGFEGLRLSAYPDGRNAAGEQLFSIGYGHNGVPQGSTITAAEADRLFDADVRRYESAVATTTPRAEPWEFDAMVSLAYNIGTAAFADSTVAARHNRGDRQGAADAFEWWNKAAGVVHKGLEARRERERDVYLHGHGGAAPAPSSRAWVALLALAGAGLLWARWR